jgi:hypothetical protein
MSVGSGTVVLPPPLAGSQLAVGRGVGSLPRSPGPLGPLLPQLAMPRAVVVVRAKRSERDIRILFHGWGWRG